MLYKAKYLTGPGVTLGEATPVRDPKCPSRRQLSISTNTNRRKIFKFSHKIPRAKKSNLSKWTPTRPQECVGCGQMTDT